MLNKKKKIAYVRNANTLNTLKMRKLRGSVRSEISKQRYNPQNPLKGLQDFLI